MKLVIEEHVPLAQFTTFKIGGLARFFCTVTDEGQLLEAVQFSKDQKIRILILGGGSNVLISDEGFNGLVIKMEIETMTTNDLVVSAGAGIMWDDLVANTIEQGLFGLENLSAIPWTVGAAPVQNIGAYGAEVSGVIQTVRALDTTTLKFVELANEQCAFGYRDSIFKRQKGRYIITRVDFRLSKVGNTNISYKDLRIYFEGKKTAPSPVEVREAVINIRWNKLPDWKLWGTAGSFFKNPVVSAQKYAELKETYPDMPGFLEQSGMFKIPLGWILDKVCNVKGMNKGNVSVFEKQALVLVAKPGAHSSEVMELAHELMHCVKEKTGIEIEGEVEWVN